MDVMRQQILSIFTSAVKSVVPRQLIKDNLQVVNDTVIVAKQVEVMLNKNLHVIGFGKATLPMASAVEECLHNHIVGGVLSIPIGTQNNFKFTNQIDCLLKSDSKIEIFEGAANNLPDDNSLRAANRIIEYLQKLTSNDVVLVLISGGGSALLPSPIAPVTLADKLKTIQLLTSSGVTIQELNVVRKQLSKLKGGGLARIASSSRIISLILSDIIGDPIDLIASGPTAFDRSNANDALTIINEFHLENTVPNSVIQLLNSKNTELPFPSRNVTNIIIGNNNTCLKAAQLVAEGFGYTTVVLSSEFDGEAKKCGEFLALLAHCICNQFETNSSDLTEQIGNHEFFRKICVDKIKELKNTVNRVRSEKLPLCIISGGETTVMIKNHNGVGGRNQELVLSSAIVLDKLFSRKLADSYHVIILSAGTDGIDGPTTAAGAFTYVIQKCNAEKENLVMEDFLENNDSHLFYKDFNNGNDLIVTGHTGTNVMDIQVMLINPVIN